MRAALAAEERNATATKALGDLWTARLAQTDFAGDTDDTAHALSMLTRYDDGRHAALIVRDGSLEFTSDPPGAAVLLRACPETSASAL